MTPLALMSIKDAIDVLEKKVPRPTQGLPDAVFYYISRTTPLVNVDLLIKDEKGRTLLAWRNDQYCGQGWHVPGGILRFKETLETRVKKVAQSEIGTLVEFEPKPIAFNEIILKQKTRGHFISFLFKCRLSSSFIPQNKGLKETDAGYLQWHQTCPHNLLKTQKKYQVFINEN